MKRALVRSALVAALVIGGNFALARPASAQQSCLNGKTGPACKNPQRTGANANNPRGGGRPASGATGPVCGNGRHVGNPHCRPGAGPGGNPPGRGNPPQVRPGTRVNRPNQVQATARSRATTARVSRAPRATKAPRANKAAAPRTGKRVVARAGSSL